MRIVFACLVSLSLMLPFTGKCSAQQNQITPATSGNSVSPVPRLIKFSGTLIDHEGQPLKGPVGVTFSLYAQQSGDSPLWMETQNVELDANGNYTALLGAESADGVPLELFATGEARWLGIQVEQNAEQPRVLLVSVPYALKAGDAQTLAGRPASDFALASAPSASSALASAKGAVTAPTPVIAATQAQTPLLASVGGTGTNDFIPIWASSTTLGNSLLFQKNGNVGIGTTSPASKLDVAGGVSLRGRVDLPPIAAATSTTGKNSNPLNLIASAFNSSSHASVNQTFRWQTEPVGNDTAAPLGKLNLLFASGGGAPAETGLSISNKGIIAFAPGQTIPTVSGNEDVTGNLAVTGSVSGSTANFTGNVTTGRQTVTGNISDTGNISATGSVSAQTGIFSGFNATQIVSVIQNGTGSGLFATTANTTGAVGALNGTATTTTGKGRGVVGSSFSSSGGVGVIGLAGSLGKPGNGIGVDGISLNTTGGGIGVSGAGFIGVQGSSAVPSGAGVIGTSAASNGIGVQGVSTATSGNTFGVQGVANSLFGIGVYGANTGKGFAGRFDGPVFVNGTQGVAGNGVSTATGDPGCGPGYAGIGFNVFALLSGCTNYSIIGDGANTYINRPLGGALLFRENNSTQMTIAPGGNVSISGKLSTGNLAVSATASNFTSASAGQCLSVLTSGNSACDTPNMSFAETTGNVPVLIIANINGIVPQDTCVLPNFYLVMDGQIIAKSVIGSSSIGTTSVTMVSLQFPAAGSHTFEVQESDDTGQCGSSTVRTAVSAPSGPLSQPGSTRTLIVRE